MAVLVAATRTNAELFGLGDRLGTIAPGKWADLIVVDGDPLRDLGCLRRPGGAPALVMVGGRIHLDRLG
jgi:imidazolonepropionase-like amidohydrolase